MRILVFASMFLLAVTAKGQNAGQFASKSTGYSARIRCILFMMHRYR